jgi:TolB-like protein/cytochrome c-type biogenesis protein CcmH/NrfG
MGLDPVSQSETCFNLGDWRVFPLRNVILRGSKERRLENRLMQTLEFLAAHPGEVLTRHRFFESVWRGRVVNEEALSRAISLLRSALDDDAHAPRYIQTIPGVGYRLIAQVAGLLQPKQAALNTGDSQQNSIAVLPFVNLSADPANEYFSDGVSEEILNVLTQVERFKVVGRTSSFAFKDTQEDLRSIGRTLNVTHLLEGSVRKADSRVRITAQLIKTDDGFHVWSETFERQLDDIFAVQDEIASAVTRALKVQLLGEPEGTQDLGGTDDTTAYQAYLLGIHYRNRGALKDTVQRAQTALERAVEHDPGYARAWAALAFTWIDKVWNGYTTHAEGVRRIDAAAMRAIELAPAMADGYLALGLLLDIDFADPRSALDTLDTALRLNPGSVRVLNQYARITSQHRRHEDSIAAARKAAELDPVSVYAAHMFGHVLYFGRRYEEAIEACGHTLELDPHYPKPHYFAAMSLHWLGRHEEAWREIQQEPLSWMRHTAATAILHRLGRPAEADAHFAALVELGKTENNFVQQADIHAQLGDTEATFDCLDGALRLGDPGLAQLLVDPFLDPVRDDPRFAALLRKVGLAG